jgi:HEAT repeat protein
MKRHVILIFVVMTAAVHADPPKEPMLFWDRPDPLGRTVPWGEEVDGKRASLQLPRVRLLFGQPLELRLVTTQRNDKPPYLRSYLDGPKANATIDWTTDKGESVPFRIQYFGWSRGSVSTDYFRLIPTGRFARYGYSMPGSYRLRASINAKRNPEDGIGWVGRLATNTIEFTVLESTPEGRKSLLPESARAAELVKLLGDPDFKKRHAAEEELLRLGIDALPVLVADREAPSAQTRESVRRIARKLTEIPRGADTTFAGLAFGPLTDAEWAAIAEHFSAHEFERMRVEAAMYGPVPFDPDAAPPKPETVKRLLADLRDQRPWVRMAAARAVPDTAGEDLMAAVVPLLDDQYTAFPRLMSIEPMREPIIAMHMRTHVLPRFGKAIIGPLLEFAAKHPRPSPINGLIIPVLGDIGFDARGLAYLDSVLKTGDHSSKLYAIKALGQYGPHGFEILLKIAKTAVQAPESNTLRRVAIETLPKVGDAKTVGPVLREFLNEKYWEFVYAAVQALDRLNVREAVPEMMRIARDETMDQNPRAAAIAAVSRLADRTDAEAMLMELTRSKSVSARGESAHWLGVIGCRAAIPRLLEPRG